MYNLSITKKEAAEYVSGLPHENPAEVRTLLSSIKLWQSALSVQHGLFWQVCLSMMCCFMASAESRLNGVTRPVASYCDNCWIPRSLTVSYSWWMWISPPVRRYGRARSIPINTFGWQQATALRTKWFCSPWFLYFSDRCFVMWCWYSPTACLYTTQQRKRVYAMCCPYTEWL